jgi:hypothetical protein
MIESLRFILAIPRAGWSVQQLGVAYSRIVIGLVPFVPGFHSVCLRRTGVDSQTRSNWNLAIVRGRSPAKDTDRKSLATYVPAVMEGGAVLSRSAGSVQPFDLSVAQLREHFRVLTSKRRKARKPGKLIRHR